MAARRDLPFPLVIICLVFIRGYTPLPTASEVTWTNPTRPLRPSGQPHETRALPPDDYYDDGDMDPSIVPATVSHGGETSQKCDYDSCLENQPSCAVLKATTGCLCPGITLHKEIPMAPDLKTVSWNGSVVVVKWCAPNSQITSYTVKVEGQRSWTFGKDQRSGRVGAIDHIAEVCVFAVNDAGESKGSCMMYHPRDNSLPLKAGLIGGALGFLLLLLLAVLLWRHKRQRKQEAGFSMHDTVVTE
ncbi:LRRN4 C-terminal-like protein [Scomber scombrus]|uniref:LRRN4 C-terminal-like protein n=1 Tax=Scomber scombrus TaxID=13677 RepID=A0AAV1N2T5_SCOSC